MENSTDKGSRRIEQVPYEDEKPMQLRQKDKFNKNVDGLRRSGMGKVLSNTVTLKLYKAMDGGYTSDLTVAYPNKNTAEEITRAMGEAYMALLRRLDQDTAKQIHEDVSGVTAMRKHREAMEEVEITIEKVKFKAASPKKWKEAREQIEAMEEGADKKASSYCFRKADTLARYLQSQAKDGEVQKDELLEAVNLILRDDSQQVRGVILGIMCTHWKFGDQVAEMLGITMTKE